MALRMVAGQSRSTAAPQWSHPNEPSPLKDELKHFMMTMFTELQNNVTEQIAKLELKMLEQHDALAQLQAEMASMADQVAPAPAAGTSYAACPEPMQRGPSGPEPLRASNHLCSWE